MPTATSLGAVRTRRLPGRDPRSHVDRALTQPQIREGHTRSGAADERTRA